MYRVVLMGCFFYLIKKIVGCLRESVYVLLCLSVKLNSVLIIYVVLFILFLNLLFDILWFMR